MILPPSGSFWRFRALAILWGTGFTKVLFLFLIPRYPKSWSSSITASSDSGCRFFPSGWRPTLRTPRWSVSVDHWLESLPKDMGLTHKTDQSGLFPHLSSTLENQSGSIMKGQIQGICWSVTRWTNSNLDTYITHITFFDWPRNSLAQAFWILRSPASKSQGAHMQTN